MYSLFKVKFNWPVFVVVVVIIRLLFPEISWLSYCAVIIALHQFGLLFNSLGSIVPVRYFMGSFMCLQMYIGPVFAYNGLDIYQYGFYKMQIPETAYFTYAIPAVAFFIAGLHITAGKLNGERINREAIAIFVQQNKMLPYYFIGIGFVGSILADFFSSSLGFVFYLLGNFKYIGLFMIIIGHKQLKPLPLTVVLASIISSSLGDAMFADLMTWILFIAAVYAIKLKPSIQLKAAASFGFILLAVIIQQLKGEYRAATWKEGQQGSLQVFSNVYAVNKKSNSIFSFESLAPSNIRINQGYIVTNIMNTVPAKVPYAMGDELLQILEAAFLPRILAPNKLNAGDRTVFMKYSGMPLAKGTSMGLSSLGDGYLNFGILGGCVFMFVLGYFYSEVLNAFQKHGKTYPVLLLFTALVFYYPIRPDCELQTILGHLVKSCFLLFAMIQIWKIDFKVRSRPTTAAYKGELEKG